MGTYKSFAIDSYLIRHHLEGKIIIAVQLYPAGARDIPSGQISFYPVGYPVESKVDRGIISIQLHIDRFQEIIGTLRYEKPLTISVFYDETSKEIHSGTISSGNEPVGEQELLNR